MKNNKHLALAILILLGLSSNSFAAQIDTYRHIVRYPYHAAPYYSYPYTTGYGYQYSAPIVNAEYSHGHNNRTIVSYPDGPLYYHNYYRVGNTMCFLKAHRLYCIY